MTGAVRNRLLAMVGIATVWGLLFAALAAANCEGEGAKLAITGSATINLNETLEYTVENTGGAPTEIKTEDLPNPAPVKFEFVGGTCLGNLNGGASCKRKIKCAAKGTGTYSVTATGGLSATITIKCD